jgi:hypothetical protein
MALRGAQRQTSSPTAASCSTAAITAYWMVSRHCLSRPRPPSRWPLAWKYSLVVQQWTAGSQSSRTGLATPESRERYITALSSTSGLHQAYRPRRQAPARLAIAKAESDAMLRDGTARRSESSWSSALHIVPKKDTVWRPCCDYRGPNTRSVRHIPPVTRQFGTEHGMRAVDHTQLDVILPYPRDL